MKIVVINLASQGARWNAVRRQFEAVGLRADRHQAVDGSALDAQLRAELAHAPLNRRQYHRPLCVGEIGCYASHLAVWRALLASGERSLAVFEDDIEPGAALPRVLQAVDQLPVGWDVVKLIGRDTEKIDTCSPLLREHTLIQYRRVPCLTSAYVITRSGAEKLLRRHPPFGRPVDVDMRYWWECGLDVFGVQPYPVREAASSQTTTIIGRQLRPTWGMRVRKLWLQCAYTLRNWQACHERRTLHRHTAPAPVAAMHATARAARGQARA